MQGLKEEGEVEGLPPVRRVFECRRVGLREAADETGVGRGLGLGGGGREGGREGE